MMELKCDFSKARRWDKVWSSRNGSGVITGACSGEGYPIEVEFENGKTATYTLGGHYSMSDLYPELFWNEIHFDIPAPPRRMMKKQMKFWVAYTFGNKYGGHISVTEDSAEANEWANKGYQVKYHTDEIEVEVEE